MSLLKCDIVIIAIQQNPFKVIFFKNKPLGNLLGGFLYAKAVARLPAVPKQSFYAVGNL